MNSPAHSYRLKPHIARQCANDWEFLLTLAKTTGLNAKSISDHFYRNKPDGELTKQQYLQPISLHLELPQNELLETVPATATPKQPVNHG